MKHKQIELVVFSLVVIVGAIIILESRKRAPGSTNVPIQEITVDVYSADRTDIVAQKSRKYDRAKEVTTPDGFINTDEITVEALVGKKIVLIDFWTYSCINCQRTFPYLNSWYEKYADDGLVILGVHTPEFEFEKDYDNVKRAVEKFGIKYPVILDNDYSTWTAYKNRYWPRKYLIDIDGFIVYDHIGEGGYDETEQKIVELLNEKNRVLGMSQVVMEDGRVEGVSSIDFSKVKTPEIYLGSSRIQYITNLPSRSCFGTSCDYIIQNDIPLSRFALGGKWQINSESAQVLEKGASIVIGFSANKVNLVAGGDFPVAAEIYLDNQLVPQIFAGSAVTNGQILFHEYGLYNLIDLGGAYGEHILQIKFLDPDIAVFALTFG